MPDTLESPTPDSNSVTSLVNVDTRERCELSPARVITIGRAEDNILSLKDDVYASGRHAEIFFEGPVCHLKDLDSRNGSFKNNEPVVGTVLIQKGDLVTFGRTKFEIE